MRADRLYLRVQKFLNKVNNGENLDDYDYGYGDVYRASLRAENQKFLSNRRVQRNLAKYESGIGPEEKEKLVEESGFSFSKAQDRAFNAVQKLLDSNKAKPDRYEHTRNFDFECMYQKIRINYADYYEAYGLTRTDGSFMGSQVERAKKALLSLEEERRIIYEKEDRGKEKFVNTRRPLVSVEEIDNKVNILPSPLFLDQLDTFHLYKPEKIHEEVKDWQGPGTNYSKAIPNLLQYLNARNPFPLKIKRRNLVDRLGLSKYEKKSQYEELDKQMTKTLKAAEDLEYLLDWQLKGGNYQFYQNPLRCSRFRHELTRSQKYRDKLESKLKELQRTGTGVSYPESTDNEIKFSVPKEVSFTRN